MRGCAWEKIKMIDATDYKGDKSMIRLFLKKGSFLYCTD